MKTFATPIIAIAASTGTMIAASVDAVASRRFDDWIFALVLGCAGVLAAAIIFSLVFIWKLVNRDERRSERDAAVLTGVTKVQAEMLDTLRGFHARIELLAHGQTLAQQERAENRKEAHEDLTAQIGQQTETLGAAIRVHDENVDARIKRIEAAAEVLAKMARTKET